MNGSVVSRSFMMTHGSKTFRLDSLQWFKTIFIISQNAGENVEYFFFGSEEKSFKNL